MSAATKDALDKLHATLANVMTSILTKGEVAVNKETGEVVMLTPSAAHLSNIRQFLRDNGVEAAPGTSKPLASLASALPFPVSAGADEAGDDSPDSHVKH
jgi:hypothetical protein